MKNNKSNIVTIVLIILLLASIGYIGYDKILSNNKDKTKVNTKIDNSNTTIDTSSTETKITFEDFTKLIQNKNIAEVSTNLNNYSVFSNIYLKDGFVYGTIKSDIESMGLANDVKSKIKNLKLESVNLQVNYNDKTKTSYQKINAYKFPLENIILMSEVYVGQSTSPTFMFENKNGIVYSFSTDQLGASASSIFNNDGNLNIKEETKFKNVIKFVNFMQSDERNSYADYYAIDIDGNVIYR